MNETKSEWEEIVRKSFSVLCKAIKKRNKQVFFSFLLSLIQMEVFRINQIRFIGELIDGWIINSNRYLKNKEYEMFLRSLLYQSREFLLELESRKNAKKYLAYINRSQTLRNISSSIMNTFEETQLIEILTRGMKDLKIPRMFLSLYEGESSNKPSNWSRLIYYYNNNQGFNLGEKGIRYQTRELVPQHLLKPNTGWSFIIEALYMQEKQIGFIVIECDATSLVSSKVICDYSA